MNHNTKELQKLFAQAQAQGLHHIAKIIQRVIAQQGEKS